MRVLNSAAIQRTGADRCDLPGVERDKHGAPTGRLLRLDAWLRDRIPARSPAAFASDVADHAAWAARLGITGITGFTDATPGRDQADVDDFARLADSSLVPQRLVLMAPPGLTLPRGDRPATGRVTLGPLKLISSICVMISGGRS